MIYRFAGFELDEARFELRRAGEPLAAEPQVLSLLILLVENRDRLISKDEVIEKVWDGRFVSDAAVTSRIKSARRLLGDDGRQQRYIRTVHGKGFRFVGEVEENEPVQTPSVADAPTAAVPGADRQQRIEFCSAADGTGLAYSCVGEGAPLIKTANWLHHLGCEWEIPIWRHMAGALAKHRRLIRFDGRGSGLSDWKVDDLSFDAFVDDIGVVAQAASASRFDLIGTAQGCAMAIAYCVRHPEKVQRLVLYNGYATGWRLRGAAEEIARREALLTLSRSGWGRENSAFRQMYTSLHFPDASAEQADWFTELQRVSVSPETVQRYEDMIADIDVRALLPEVRVPTLIFHSRDNKAVPFEAGRELGQAIPGASFVALDSPNHLLFENEPAWIKFTANLWDFLTEDDVPLHSSAAEKEPDGF
ncbi:alpha/beta fold hydrolase [Parasphingopyxis algicola]|uniref:alpha/beta fold hydrolase n=1 Tax=Parasphingopyxis algicola TaxID=2026624 RepID=UPI0015A25975|nr:alpha/beta fold hydrolase [Parasphingopyxis algicola]QLC23966.1 alpha/beta fold hydrolase [Parasphingopyxis algicola]